MTLFAHGTEDRRGACARVADIEGASRHSAREAVALGRVTSTPVPTVMRTCGSAGRSHTQLAGCR